MMNQIETILTKHNVSFTRDGNSVIVHSETEKEGPICDITWDLIRHELIDFQIESVNGAIVRINYE